MESRRPLMGKGLTVNGRRELSEPDDGLRSFTIGQPTAHAEGGALFNRQEPHVIPNQHELS